MTSAQINELELRALKLVIAHFTGYLAGQSVHLTGYPPARSAQWQGARSVSPGNNSVRILDVPDSSTASGVN